MVTMNDRSTSSKATSRSVDGRIAAIAPAHSRPTRSGHRRPRRLRAARFHPDAYPSVSNAVSRLRRRPAADGLAPPRVWPMEAAHTPHSLRAAARLAATELLASGTTSVLTMETVHDTDAVFEAVAESGLRATIGKCMMDFDARGAKRLQEGRRRRSTRASRSANGGTAPPTAGCVPRSRRVSPSRARASCSKRWRACQRPSMRARSHARLGIARRACDRADHLRRACQHRVPGDGCTSRHPVCAPRTASWWTTASRNCSPGTTSR